MKHAGARSGFTLAELAVTVVIVAIALLMVLEGLSVSKITAAHTRNMKAARDLGLITLAQIESGLVRDDIQTGMVGTYAEEGWPDFNWEVAVGDDALPQSRGDGRYDSWAPTLSEKTAKEKEEEEDAEEPFEKVRVRVTFPRIREFSNELTLERWIPWAQVYGAAEGENASRNSRASRAASGAGGTGAAAGGAGKMTPAPGGGK